VQKYGLYIEYDGMKASISVKTEETTTKNPNLLLVTFKLGVIFFIGVAIVIIFHQLKINRLKR